VLLTNIFGRGAGRRIGMLGVHGRLGVPARF
jgi:hypothetical protein